MIEQQLPETISQTGYLSFRLTVTEPLYNGIGARSMECILASLPGLAQCRLISHTSTINITFEWESGAGAARYDRGFMVDLIDLPGPRDYFLQFTWDSHEGRCDGYFNGIPLRIAGTRFTPWQIAGAATRLVAIPATYRVSNTEVHARFIPPEEIVRLVPPPLLQRDGSLIGATIPDARMSIHWNTTDEQPIYTVKPGRKTDLQSWKMEGPGEVSPTPDGWLMRTSSSKPASAPGHFVYWCPVILPESFIAEWEFKPLNSKGLAIVFFAAAGPGAVDIFDRHLPARDGIFSQYTQGDLHSYHITYFANLPLFQTGRPTSNLRKNSGFYLVAQGPVAIRPDAQQFQKLRLVKCRSHIAFYSGDRPVLDWHDSNPSRFGPAHGAGRIGLRQMEGTVGEYRNLNIRALPHPPPRA